MPKPVAARLDPFQNIVNMSGGGYFVAVYFQFFAQYNDYNSTLVVDYDFSPLGRIAYSSGGGYPAGPVDIDGNVLPWQPTITLRPVSQDETQFGKVLLDRTTPDQSYETFTIYGCSAKSQVSIDTDSIVGNLGQYPTKAQWIASGGAPNTFASQQMAALLAGPMFLPFHCIDPVNGETYTWVGLPPSFGATKENHDGDERYRTNMPGYPNFSDSAESDRDSYASSYQDSWDIFYSEGQTDHHLVKSWNDSNSSQTTWVVGMNEKLTVFEFPAISKPAQAVGGTIPSAYTITMNEGYPVYVETYVYPKKSIKFDATNKRHGPYGGENIKDRVYFPFKWANATDENPIGTPPKNVKGEEWPGTLDDWAGIAHGPNHDANSVINAAIEWTYMDVPFHTTDGGDTYVSGPVKFDHVLTFDKHLKQPLTETQKLDKSLKDEILQLYLSKTTPAYASVDDDWPEWGINGYCDVPFGNFFYASDWDPLWQDPFPGAEMIAGGPLPKIDKDEI